MSLTQIIVCRLQGSTTLPQDVHLKHRLRFGFHSEGGDGMVIDAFCHAVIQTLNQLLYISIELVHALSVLWLEGKRDRSHQKQEHEVKTNPESVSV